MSDRALLAAVGSRVKRDAGIVEQRVELDNISSKLTQRELDAIQRKFNTLDINKDGFISALEVELFERNEDRMSRDEDDTRTNEFLIKALVKSFMRFRDLNRDGQVSWEEFLSLESVLALDKRQDNSIVELLTDKEKEMEKAHFAEFDENGDGSISGEETKLCLSRRFWHLVEKGLMTEEELKQMVENRVQDFFEEGDENSDGVITWDEYIRAHAKFLLTERVKQIHQDLHKVLEEKSLLPRDIRDKAERCFLAADADSSGKIDEEELREVLRFVGLNLTPMELDMYVSQLFPTLTDGEGITLEKFYILFNAIYIEKARMDDFV
mmetsp:Transcript_9029/g.24556  ORF Transcript_9029/g.24556 Transcript_9029/m.24556 type:complete len:324 (-) Transcript_9029:47-1018(-)|eukprot:CAMPEP_0113896244 /NCGR_PEP_ID=MMETSP0780_2-20120614/17882_1 /TAXON_ID=652834 /ORGANISM="Palpitomonas bilix" /LENGTH=323 /DNA_ID=CAMNT_0000887307 /DNA_START=138 /DNA_END=1109 /DNA_ORIENTATION=+ /assembly_acc=CAM_ASM_000599